MSPIKTFMDDTTLIMNRKQAVQKTVDKIDSRWGGVEWLSSLWNQGVSPWSGIHSQGRAIRCGGQQIPTVSEEPVICLGRVFWQISHRQKYEERHTPTNQRGTASDRGGAAAWGAFKCGCSSSCSFQGCLLWPLIIYEIGLSGVVDLERKVHRYTRKWLGLPPALSSVALCSRSATAAEVHRGRVQALQNKNAVDAQQLRWQQDPRGQATAQIWKEIPSAEWDRRFSSRADVRGSKRSYPDGPSCCWVEPSSKMVPFVMDMSHLSHGSSVRAAMISQERRRTVEQDKFSATAHMPLPMVGIHGDITRSFEKCVRPLKQQLPKQTRARSQSSGRISCETASHTSAKRDVKRSGETFL